MVVCWLVQAAAEKAAAEKALAEKKRKEEEAARREAQERARKAKEAEARAKAKAAKEAKEREEAERKRKADAAKREEAERKAKEEAKRIAEEKRQKEARAKKEAEPEPTIPVGTADVYMAFTMPKCKSEPSQSDYEAVAATTRDFYTKHLRSKYKTFNRVEVAVSRAYFGQNKPDKRYNVYLEWDVKAYFAESGGPVPDRYQLCTSLVKTTDLMAFMSKHLDSLKGTPFEGTCGIFTEQVNSILSA